jgi:thioredoxin reductase (NADPH)
MSKPKTPDIFDITFIGAGPTGLFGAFYAGLREMSIKVIDALPQAGGQLITLYPEKMIYDTPGFKAVMAKQLVSQLVDQASQWNPAWALGERALKLLPVQIAGEDGDIWRIETDEAEHLSRSVVIAGGIGAFRPTKLKNESIERLEGKGVDYLVENLDDYSAKKVIVVGGGDSAVDWALALQDIAEHTTLIHRREGFRAHDSSVNALMESDVEVLIHYELAEVQGQDRVERALIFNNRTDEETTVDVDAVILSLGFKADLGPIREWGLETIGRRYLKVNNKMETNLPGVYAAGDIALQEDLDPLNLIVVGYGQVTVAVNYAYTRIKPGGKVFPGHSSEKMAGSN